MTILLGRERGDAAYGKRLSRLEGRDVLAKRGVWRFLRHVCRKCSRESGAREALAANAARGSETETEAETEKLSTMTGVLIAMEMEMLYGVASASRQQQDS